MPKHVDRREFYRSTLAHRSPQLTLSLWTESGDQHRNVRVEDLSLAGTCLTFLNQSSPNLRMQERVLIRFHGRGLDVMMTAVVRHVLELDRYTRVGLEFPERESVLRSLPRALFRFFNRRATPRASELDLPCEATTNDGSEEATICDLSAEGLGLLMPTKNPPLLRPDQSVRLRFQLSSCERPILMTGRVANCRVVIDDRCRSRFGIQFEPESTPEFKESQEMIEVYVSESLSHVR